LTAVYAFTDYHSQGQTLLYIFVDIATLYIFVDIATPPSGGLSLFNLYVVLSRSSQWKNNLELNEKTKEWWRKMTSRDEENAM
ncbi:hypothetical protein DFH07DRAFT_751383, partial [Mycena maculata]